MHLFTFFKPHPFSLHPRTVASALSVALCAAWLATPLTAHAQSPGSQQSRMKTCNVDAQGKKGDERRAFMSQCLRGPVASAPGEATPKASRAGKAQKAPSKPTSKDKARAEALPQAPAPALSGSRT